MPSAAELRELHDDELYNRLAESRRELMNLRFQLATGQLDNAARIGMVKKDVARVLTLLRDREIALAEGRDAAPVFREPRPVSDEPPRRRTRARAAEEVLDDEQDDTDIVDDDVDDEVDTDFDGDTDEAEDAEEDE